MAAEIKESLGLEVALIPGAKGEFTVRVDSRVVAQKSGDDFPAPQHCAEQVKNAIRPS